MCYKVEFFYWEDCEIFCVNWVECICSLFNDYDEDWVFYYMGEFNDEYILIIFICKEDWECKCCLKLVDL